MKKKLISLLLVTAMTASMLAGCGTNAGEEVEEETEATYEMATAEEAKGAEITFWHSMGGVNGEAIAELVENFNNENELGIKVVAEYQGEYDDSLNKLKSAQMGNMGADLVQVYEIGTRFMIESGWIVPMQNLIDADNYDVSSLEENLLAYYSFDDQLFSMPFYSSTPLMYYN